MAWQFVQGKKFSFGAGSSQAGALTSNISVGNRLIVFAYVYGSGITLSSVSDNLGNQGSSSGKYDQLFSQSDTFNGHLYALTAPITTGGSCTITVTASGSASFISFWAGEYSGLSTVTGSGAWDLFVSNGGTIANSMGTGTSSGTVTSTGELAVLGFGDTLAGGSTSIASPSGWTERFNDTAAAADIPLLIDDQTPTAGSTISWTTTFGGSDAGNGYAAGLVVFKLPPPTATTWFFPPIKNFTQPGFAFTPSVRSNVSPKSTTTDVATRFICAPPITGASLPLLTTTGVKGTTGGNQRGQHLIFAQNSGRWWFFTYGPVLDSGTATSGSVAALNDTTKSWAASTFNGASCIIIRGTGAGQAFEIGPNTSNSLPVKNNGDVVPPQPGLKTAPDNTSVYIILESRSVKAYVSSGPDLASATWSEATGSPSPTLPNNSGIDVSGGANDGGSVGSDIPTDGRLLAVGYMNVNGVDVVQLLTNENLHWIKYSERARLGVGDPATISWDLTGPSTWYDSFDSHNEDAPAFPQVTAIRASNTHRWHVLQHQNSLPHAGIIANPSVTDDGSFNLAPAWGGVYSDLDTANFFAWCGSLTALDSGFMLAVYVNGTRDAAAVGTGISHQTGLRYIESASESAWPTTPGGAAVPGLSTTANSPNDWDIAAPITTDVHLVRRNGPTTFEHVRYSGHNGSWGTVDTLPSQGLTGHLAGSGVALITDGQNVWCFIIDADLNHSIKYLKWKAGAWDTSWSILPTGGEYKDFITATWSSATGQAGIAWTANAQQPYAVNYAVFSPPAVPGSMPVQNFNKLGPYPSFIPDPRSTNVAALAYSDVATRFLVPTFGNADAKTRFSVNALPGAFLPPNTYHPGSSPGGYYQFIADTRAANAPTPTYGDTATRLVIDTQEGATYLQTNLLIHPGIKGPGYGYNYYNDIRSADSPTSLISDAPTRMSVLSLPSVPVPGSQIPTIIFPGLNGPLTGLRFQSDTRNQNSPVIAHSDTSTRVIINALPGAQIEKGTYHPGKSPGGYSRFISDIRSTTRPTTSNSDAATRVIVIAHQGALLDRGTFHPGSSPGGYSRFISDSRSTNSPTTLNSDITTRLIVNRFISMGAGILGITLPGNYPKSDPSFRNPVKSLIAPTPLFGDAKTRLTVASSALTGVLSPYIFTGRLGRTESQLGSMQLGVDRKFYTGALEAMSTSLSDVETGGASLIVVQPRPFVLSTQSGSVRFGTIVVQPRPFTLSVQPVT